MSRIVANSRTNLISVAGVATLEEALGRVKDYAFPLEDCRSRMAYGKPSQMNKWAMLAGEQVAGRITLRLVAEVLGY